MRARGALALEALSLEKRFGGLIAARSIDLSVHVGEIVALIGPNGAGKSTIFNLISGALAGAGPVTVTGTTNWTGGGVTGVLDIPANGKSNRGWMRALIDEAQAAHELHVLDVPDAVCKQRLRARNESGAHPFKTSDRDYDLFTAYFDPPTPDEGFDVVLHRFDDS